MARTPRQTDRHTHREGAGEWYLGRDKDTKTDRQTERGDTCVMPRTLKETDRQTNTQTNRRTHRHTDRQTDRQTDKQTHRQTHRQTDRQGCYLGRGKAPRHSCTAVSPGGRGRWPRSWLRRQ